MLTTYAQCKATVWSLIKLLYLVHKEFEKTIFNSVKSQKWHFRGVWKVSHVQLGHVITHLKDFCTKIIFVITVFNYGHPNVKGTPKEKILKLEDTKLNKVLGTLSTSCYQSYDRSIKYKSVLYLKR